MYDRTTVQGATFNMRGQLYHGHANATALFSSPVVKALGSESDHPGSSHGWARRCALETCGKKKIRAPLLGLAKSIYYLCYTDTARLGESFSPFSNVWLSGVKYTF